MPGVLEIAEALADALTAVSPQLTMTVEPRMVFTPAADACIDIYPATPAEGNTSFGPASRMHWFTVRLRVATADTDGAQDFLYNARDPTGPESIREALFADGTDLSGLVDEITIPDGSPTGFQLYEDSGGTGGVVRYLGEEWRVGVMVSEET